MTEAAPANETGYDLWLRYRHIGDSRRLAELRAVATQLVIAGDSPTLRAARDELLTALRAMGAPISVADHPSRDGAIIVGTTASALIRSLPIAAEAQGQGADGFIVRSTAVNDHRAIVVAGVNELGALYGTFRLLRAMQTSAPLANLTIADHPRIALRMLDHWDNLDRTVERGYAGRSIWEWNRLPDTVSPRYRDYARANASIGINGAALTNVNANVRTITPKYIAKAAAIANVLRPYGIRVFLTVRFSSPVEIGGLKTADPLDPAVQAWWKAKADEIYRAIPDFGGFVVKANSEGQPGPRDYKRTHAEGANLIADALAPHHGVVIWRAFVYSDGVPTDRVRQAYDEFKPLDGKFHDNVFVQVKNGPLDFQPREPFHPLFGAMPNTPLMAEFQITKEYLGQDTHLVYLGAEWDEILKSDTYAAGPGSTVARVIDGSITGQTHTGIAGVSNVGTDTNWTGSQFNQANWYSFGRLAWNPELSSRDIANEWIRMTFSNDPKVVRTIEHMMMVSREAVVNYMTPLGLAHIMATGHHYGPGPWVSNAGRADWSPTYYHRADTLGIGFDRAPSGSNAVAQYFSPLRERYASLDSTPENLLLWFHHVPWTYKLHSGRTLWDGLVAHYSAGVDTVRAMRREWESVQPAIDAERFAQVDSFLVIQEHEATWWRDAALDYFQQFSRMPIPAGYEQPAHPLSFYLGLRCPANRDKPRCPQIY